MKETYGYIYLTTNLINNRKYIGQHKYNGEFDPKYLGSGKILTQAIQKYGIENFNIEVLEYAYNEEELDRLEKDYIKKYNAVFSEEFYNITTGGIGGARYGKYNNWSTEDKTGENNPFYGKRHSEQTKKQISETKKGTEPWNKNKKMSKEQLLKRNKPSKFNLICITCDINFIGEAAGVKNCPNCKEKILLEQKNNRIYGNPNKKRKSRKLKISE